MESTRPYTEPIRAALDALQMLIGTELAAAAHELLELRFTVLRSALPAEQRVQVAHIDAALDHLVTLGLDEGACCDAFSRAHYPDEHVGWIGWTIVGTGASASAVLTDYERDHGQDVAILFIVSPHDDPSPPPIARARG